MRGSCNCISDRLWAWEPGSAFTFHSLNCDNMKHNLTRHSSGTEDKAEQPIAIWRLRGGLGFDPDTGVEDFKLSNTTRGAHGKIRREFVVNIDKWIHVRNDKRKKEYGSWNNMQHPFLKTQLI